MKEKSILLLLGSSALITNVVLLILIYNFFRTILQKTKRVYSLLIGILFVVEYTVFQLLLEMLNNSRHDPGVEYGPESIELLLFQTAITILALSITKMVQKWEKRYLSKASIKSGVDSLPAGLLFYWKEGVVKLVNIKMDRISHQLTGEGIYSGTAFWDMLLKKDMALLSNSGSAENKNECMVRLEDGSVYLFKRNICRFEEHDLYEIIATDVSEEQLLNEELKIKQIKADEIKKRLKNLNSEIELMTVEKEILETKSKVHDDLGKTLIMSRRFLENRDENLKAEVIKQWKLNTLLLRGEEDDEKIFEYSSTLRDIGKLGLELKIEGNLPTDKERKEVVVSALRTCATNALRHGGGTELNVKISEQTGENRLIYGKKIKQVIEISNNGSLPENGYTEGGGLGNLRKLVERTGGNMRIESREVFKVIIALPA